MEAYLEGWHEFDVAMMGATAALAGLVIVAASVNIAEVVKAPSLTARLAAGISGLVLAIVGSAVGLIPGIEAAPYRATMMVAALVSLVFPVQAARQIFRNRHPQNRMRAAKSAIGFLTPLAYLIGGVLLAAGQPAGALWLAIGAIASIIAALLISWVALVEVLR